MDELVANQMIGLKILGWVLRSRTNDLATGTSFLYGAVSYAVAFKVAFFRFPKLLEFG